MLHCLITVSTCQSFLFPSTCARERPRACTLLCFSMAMDYYLDYYKMLEDIRLDIKKLSEDIGPVVIVILVNEP